MKKYPSLFDILAIVGVFFFSSAFLGGTVSFLMSRFGADEQQTLAAVYPIPMVCTALFALFYGRGRGGGRLHAISFALPPRRWGVAAGGLALMLAVSVVLEPLLALFPEEWFEWMTSMLGGRGVLTFVTLAVVAPILEELLFRGIVQRSAVGAYGPAWGITIAAALFGVIHIIPMQVINAFALGLVLGYVYHKTRSLTAVILMHAANNALSFQLMGVGPADATLRDVMPSAGAYYAVYALCAAVAAIGGTLIVRDLGRRRNLTAY